MKNPLVSRKVPKSAHGYSAFPMDNFANFTSVAGYLIPVYWDYLEPGDKVTCKTLLRTRTQPLKKPAMATVIERVEWFAVPIPQLYKLFSSKYYGINDQESDVLPTNGLNDYTPFINLDDLSDWILSLPTTFNAQSSIPVSTPTLAEAKRLCDAMGLPDSLGSASRPSGYTYNTSISVLPFAAYQKIYYDHYRLTDREENDPKAYNFDSYFGTTGVSAQVLDASPDYRYRKLFYLRKRPYMRDYFTSMQVSPLFGSSDVNAAGNDLGAINNWISGLSKVDTSVPYSLTTSYPEGGFESINSSSPTDVRINGTSTQATYGGIMGALNPSNIRSMFAVEKLLNITRKAKKHYDMQTLAHFGVKVPKGIAGECFKLGTHEQYLKIGDVVSTADTSTGSLGQLAGQGSSGAESKKIHFEADCHCVLMAIYSAEPVVNINSDGMSRLFTQIRTSEWYKSEFDNLGMQPVFRYELYTNCESGVPYGNDIVLGWQYRYYQNKMKYNRSFAGISTSYFLEWALNRTSIGTGSSFSRNFFYVWPTDMNDILLNSYTGSVNHSTCYSEDYLINQIYFDVIKSSKKSIYGEPNL